MHQSQKEHRLHKGIVLTATNSALLATYPIWNLTIGVALISIIGTSIAMGLALIPVAGIPLGIGAAIATLIALSAFAVGGLAIPIVGLAYGVLDLAKYFTLNDNGSEQKNTLQHNNSIELLKAKLANTQDLNQTNMVELKDKIVNQYHVNPDIFKANESSTLQLNNKLMQLKNDIEGLKHSDLPSPDDRLKLVRDFKDLHHEIRHEEKNLRAKLKNELNRNDYKEVKKLLKDQKRSSMARLFDVSKDQTDIASKNSPDISHAASVKM